MTKNTVQKTLIEKLTKIFQKPPLDCEYVYGILGEIFDFIDCEKHISILVERQERLDSEMGAWSESIDFLKGEEAPLATAEVVLALVNFAARSEVKNVIKRACKYLVQSQNDDDGGWADLSGDYSVVDATGCIITAFSEVERWNIFATPVKKLEKALDFLLWQQNDDGGWGVIRNDESKMHYTYFALMGLARFKNMLPNKKKEVHKAIKKAIVWIEENSHKNTDNGVGLSTDSAPSPIATALAILCLLEIGKPRSIKAKWIEFLKKSQKNGGWDEISDSSLVHGIRRTYDFRSIPQIIEALVRSGEPIYSVVIGSALRELKKYELPSGGFVRDVGETNPIVWFTSWSLRVMYFLRQELSDNLSMYVDHSIKNAAEVKRKLENYERESKLEKNFMTYFASASIVMILLCTYLLYLITSSSYGKLVWYLFFVISILAFEGATAYYWNKRGKMNEFRSFLLGIIWIAITVLLGFVG